MLKPLDDIEQTVQLIAQVGQSPVEEVRERLRAEVAEIGTNVHRYLVEHNIPMYTASEELDKFYREDDSFLYETTVWNTCKAKQEMRDFIQSRLVKLLDGPADMFCVGDGLGFDSAWLARQGHNVLYSEPSLRCQAYAREVFRQNDVNVTELDSYENIEPESLDVVVCLDVLEHVPQPQNLVTQFHKWLRPGGLFFVHAPFWCLHWTRSTHLRENLPLSGDLNFFTDVGFNPLDSVLFWNPILLQKAGGPVSHRATAAARFRIQAGKLLLRLGRSNSVIHTAVARMIAKPPRWWRDAINA